jgi:hypothetical protein
MTFDPVDIAKKYNGELVGGCVSAVVGGKKEYLIIRKEGTHVPTELLLALESGTPAPKKGKKKAEEPKAEDTDVAAALNDE